MNILVTGGAGFIGSHIVDELIQQGHKVTVIDSFEKQVHADVKPKYLNKKAQYVWSPLGAHQILDKILPSIDVVCHQAALVGLGQSMYEISRYCDFSIQQTAVLVEKISQHKNIRKLVVASSMSVYGEGKYLKQNGEIVRPGDRLHYSSAGSFDLFDGNQKMQPIPISEDDHLSPYSIYGLTKLTQEKLALITGKAYDIPTIALRYFGVYGRRQSLTNPYAGLVAMFAGSIMNGKAPMVFEDGEQIRDFIHVKDVARANVIALTETGIPTGAYNLTSGIPTTVKQVADILCQIINPTIEPHLTQKYRKGDIRHCFGDVKKIEQHMGFKTQIDIVEGLQDFADWVIAQKQFNNMSVMEGELLNKSLLVERLV
jgi:dTDP-L-rhamnose 4-epimerase